MSRYAALRASAAGTFSFDACIVPIGSTERAVADAVVSIFADKRVALVLDDTAQPHVPLPPHFAVIRRSDYDSGSFSLAWLSAREPVATAAGAARTTPLPSIALDDDRTRATRRIQSFATAQRRELTADESRAAGLDMLAVLDDEVHWWRASGSGFGMVLLHIGGLFDGVSDGEGRETAAGAVLAALQSVARRSDTLARQREDFVIILPEADAGGAAMVARRAVAALSVAHDGLPSRPRKAKGLAAWSAGVASCPGDGASREALVARASATLRPFDQWMRER